jgi:hypothetical protein
MFDEFDVDGDGSIQFSELKMALCSMGYSLKEKEYKVRQQFLVDMDNLSSVTHLVSSTLWTAVTLMAMVELPSTSSGCFYAPKRNVSEKTEESRCRVWWCQVHGEKPGKEGGCGYQSYESLSAKCVAAEYIVLCSPVFSTNLVSGCVYLSQQQIIYIYTYIYIYIYMCAIHT